MQSSSLDPAVRRSMDLAGLEQELSVEARVLGGYGVFDYYLLPPLGPHLPAM